MRAEDHSKYSSDYTEEFNWNWVDSHRLGCVAVGIKDQIRDDLHTTDRLLVPGLRAALNLIAKVAELYLPGDLQE